MTHHLIPAADLQKVRKALIDACHHKAHKAHNVTEALAIIDAAQPVGEVAWALTNGEITQNVAIKLVHDCRNHDKAIPLYGASK